MAKSQRQEIEAAYAAAGLILSKTRKATAACVVEEVSEQKLQVLLDDLQVEVDQSAPKISDVEFQLSLTAGQEGFELPGCGLVHSSVCAAVVAFARLVLKLGKKESAEDILLGEEKSPAKAISECMKILGYPDWKLSQPLSYELARTIERLDQGVEHFPEQVESGLGTLPAWGAKLGTPRGTMMSRLTTYNKKHCAADEIITPIKLGKKHLYTEDQVRKVFPGLLD